MADNTALIVGAVIIVVLIIIGLIAYFATQPAEPVPVSQPLLPVNGQAPANGQQQPAPQPPAPSNGQQQPPDPTEPSVPIEYTLFDNEWGSYLSCQDHPNFQNVLSPNICTVLKPELQQTCSSIPDCMGYGWPDTTSGIWANHGALFQPAPTDTGRNPKDDWRIYVKNSYL